MRTRRRLDEDTVVLPRVSASPRDGIGRRSVRGLGEVLITVGLVILLFVVYEVYVTDLISMRKQANADAQLDARWDADANTVTPDPQRPVRTNLVPGEAFAKMYIPALGRDYQFAVVEGTTPADLEIGPGHYRATAGPGEKGNFAVAGHRVGKGAPFNDLDLLQSCDAVVVETESMWFVYRVLPMTNEEASWTQDKERHPRCAGVQPLERSHGAPYANTPGQEIVRPEQGEVIDPVPNYRGELSADQLASLMTMTTCHPKFSDRQRLIVHAVLTQSYPKRPGFLPGELTEE
ncbi:class E sortase [Lentzea sokolovensis]|uniref:class E sortase n=1 Tax=Lentzea sokolovensis TaxID=3095429 RepID=UPI0029F49ADD|nr:class E sortase [Lentzea sp. BCCO 10_0061]